MNENFPRPDMHPLDSVDTKRQQRITQLQSALENLLQQTGYEAVLLTCPENLNWFSAGGDYQRFTARQDLQAAIFVTKDKRVLLARAAIAETLMTEDFAGLGFQLKVRQDQSGLEELLDEITRGRKVCSDSGFGRTRSIKDQLHILRSRTAGWFSSDWCQIQQRLEQTVKDLLTTISPCTSASLWPALLRNMLEQSGLRVVEIAIQSFSPPAFMRDEHWSKQAIMVRITVCQSGWYFCTQYLVAPTPLEPLIEQGLTFLQQGFITLHDDLPRLSDGQSENSWIHHCFSQFDFPYDWQIDGQLLRLGYRYPEEEIRLFPHSPLPCNNGYYLEIQFGPFSLGVSFWLTAEREIRFSSATAAVDNLPSFEQKLSDSIIRWNA